MPVHPVLRKDLQDQLHELSTRSIIFPAERPPRVRQPQCYLTWSKEKEGSKAVTLGPYARWLIAADLLMLGSGYEKLHDELASCISESTGDDSKFAAVDRVFINNGVRSDRRYVEAWRYGMSSHVEYGRPVLKALRKRIEQKYLASRGCGFSKQEFLTVPVPINPFSTTLGYEPIAWFRNWIRWNVGVPYSDPRDRALHDAVDPADRALLNEVVTVLGNATQLEHQRIINVAASDLRGSTSSFAAAISHALANHKNADGHDDSIPVVRVRLAIRATRQSVVHDLYNAFQFSDGVSKGSIDLSTDIQPLRKALTTNKVVVIFEAYDNVRGAFHTLNEFLNHTHWPELLRVLAQPDPTVWTTTPTNERPPLQYALVVLSTRRTQQLWPWVYPLPDPDDANAREQTPNVDTNASTSGRRSAECEATRLTMAQIQTLERVSTEHHDPQERKKAWIRLVDLMAIRTVAASVNGVRKRTLQRCMEYWWSHFWSGKVQKEDCAVFQGIFPERVANLGSQFQELLIEVSEEEVQGLRAEFRGLELDRHPQYYIDEGKVFIFESRASRSKFVSTWIAMEGKDDPKSEPIKTTCSWGHLNLLLAEECLRQGTSQLLHLGTDGQSSPYTLRRVIQAIFHGLMSLDVDRADFSEKDISASIFDVKDDYFETARLDEAVHELSVPATRGFRRPVLPPDASKRYRYLYVFLYRRVVEGGEWRFARSFGRSDVRLDLLTLFVQPQFGWRMLTESFGIQEMKPLDSLDPESVALPLRRSPDRAWWGDLFEALGRSGCDLGTPRGMEATKRALAELPKNHPQSRLLPQSQDSLRISAGKLHVDLLLKQGKLTKAETKVEDAETNAEDSCWDELTGLQIDRSAFDRFRIHVLGIVNNAPWDSSEDTEGRALTSSLHVACERFLRLLKKNTPSSSIVRGNASAFLFRFGEILYRKAQQKAPSDVEASKVQAGELAYAFAVCWVADGLRSESGILSDRGLDWPLAGARSMRYYIRICLDLAQLLTETSKGRLRHLTNQLLETAQTRIGMYTRHHPFKREHANILTLQVNRIRAWAHVDFERQQPVAGDDSEARARDAQAYEQVWKILVSCWQLLEDAEAHLLSLGYQSGHVRRIYLERIDTALRMGMLEVRYRTLPSNSVSRERLQEVTGHLELAAYLLFGLKALSANSDYWTKIIQRKEEMLGDLLKQWKSISLRIPALDASKPARVRRARPGRPRRRQEPPQPPAAET